MQLSKSLNSSQKHQGHKAGATPREAREQRALLAARALVDRMRAMYRELEQLTGAPIAAHRALTCVGGDPGMTASKLASSLGMKRPAVSHILKDLAERGWIERVRHDDDQRSVRLFVTAEGRKVLKATSGKAVATLQRAVSRLSDNDLTSITGALSTLLGHLPDIAPRAHRREPKRR
jgi:DNA-binding MarR family transcriptional regulator